MSSADGNCTESGAEGARAPNLPPHQLNFYDAMSDFKLMFPTMDDEIIEAVLRSNNGAVDGTIDQLLQMSGDPDPGSPAFPPGQLSPGADWTEGGDGDIAAPRTGAEARDRLRVSNTDYTVQLLYAFFQINS